LKPTEQAAQFARCVRFGNHGRTITCRLGLWRVDAFTAEEAEREAIRYWVQYWQDGEYDELLSTAGKE
jgi:hypothetical protein